MDKATEKNDQQSVKMLLTLPTELLVYIISFLTMAQDKITLRYVSLRLQRISETPSLWREFMWPYYHTGDENRVNKVLKVCGKHVKRLSFLDHVRPRKLIGMLGNCSNLIQLILPATSLNAKELGAVLLQVRHLQRLDIQWYDRNIKQLLEMLIDTKLKELTIRLECISWYEKVGRGSWMHYWLMKNFAPQQINFVSNILYLNEFYKRTLWAYWVAFNSESPAGHTGQIQLYTNLNSPINSPALPLLQLDFGRTVVSPYVSASSIGLQGIQSDLLQLTNCTCNSTVVHKAAIKDRNDEVKVARGKVNQGITNLIFVTEFIALCGGSFCSEQLEQLAIVCPNLHRLGLQGNKNCLKVLQGLSAIADSCCNLQGLDISNIPIKKVDDQMLLWGILSNMKLTHLAVDFCIIVPTIENKETLNSLFQKLTILQRLESNCVCSACCKGVEKSMSVLSYFTSLIHFTTSIQADHSAFIEAFNSCRKLRCLNYTGTILNLDLSSLMPCHNLQQFRINLCAAHLSDTFLTTISAHGKLVHVVLCVQSMTSEGITALIKNSPELMTFHCLVYDEIVDSECDEVDPDSLKYRLKYEYSKSHLFVRGSCILKVDDGDDYNMESGLDKVTESDTDLFSLWDVYYSRNM